MHPREDCPRKIYGNKNSLASFPLSTCGAQRDDSNSCEGESIEFLCMQESGVEGQEQH